MANHAHNCRSWIDPAQLRRSTFVGVTLESQQSGGSGPVPCIEWSGPGHCHFPSWGGCLWSDCLHLGREVTLDRPEEHLSQWVKGSYFLSVYPRWQLPDHAFSRIQWRHYLHWENAAVCRWSPRHEWTALVYSPWNLGAGLGESSVHDSSLGGSILNCNSLEYPGRWVGWSTPALEMMYVSGQDHQGYRHLACHLSAWDEPYRSPSGGHTFGIQIFLERTFSCGCTKTIQLKSSVPFQKIGPRNGIRYM